MLRGHCLLANMMRYCAPITLTPFCRTLWRGRMNWGTAFRTGTVDCFSRQNFDIIKTRDAFGHVPIDYIAGKYASMAGPAFAALYWP